MSWIPVITIYPKTGYSSILDKDVMIRLCGIRPEDLSFEMTSVKLLTNPTFTLFASQVLREAARIIHKIVAEWQRKPLSKDCVWACVLKSTPSPHAWLTNKQRPHCHSRDEFTEDTKLTSTESPENEHMLMIARQWARGANWWMMTITVVIIIFTHVVFSCGPTVEARKLSGCTLRIWTPGTAALTSTVYWKRL